MNVKVCQALGGFKVNTKQSLLDVNILKPVLTEPSLASLEPNYVLYLNPA